MRNHGPQAITATSIDYNRWKVVPAMISTHLCLGGIYSWSLYNGPLTHEIGIITSVAEDWSLASVVPVFSTIVFMNGFAGAVLGKWIDRVGPRIALSTGGLCYGGGIILGSFGVAMHSLPLVYTGYSIAGLGHGICYISPISTLIRWFPDKPGLATGMAVMGLGGGAVASTPIIDRLLTKNFRAPHEVTESVLTNSIITTNDKGQKFIDMSANMQQTITDITLDGNMAQIVQLNSMDLISSGLSAKVIETLTDGATYLVGSGATGAATTMMIVGSAYLAIISVSSVFTKLPHKNYDPLQNKNENAEDAKFVPASLTVEEAFRTPQFWCMWLALFASSVHGMGCISTAKTMMSEVFASSLPSIVTASFAGTYVMAISAANLSGRFGWGALSDKIGPFATFNVFGIGCCSLYFLVPMYVSQVVDNPSIVPLTMFYASTLFCFSCFGGGFSVMPPYEAKVFGARNVGAIHGRMMTSVACAGFVGPMIVTRLRKNTYESSIHDLVEHVPPENFLAHFGKPITDLDILIESKVVTINKMLELVPNDVSIVDPTPFLYDSTMYAMSGVMALCAVGNMGIRMLGKPKLLK